MNIRKFETQKHSKFQFGYRWPLVNIFDQISSHQLSWMAAITRNHKNNHYHSQNPCRDKHRTEFTKVATITHRLSMETCNKKQPPLSLGQSSTLTSCQPCWMAATTRIYNSGCYHSHRELQKIQIPLSLGQFSTLTSCRFYSSCQFY